ncbi:unnamed protein product [Gongylonema pulchrum]|uniref:Secreted protein n=1 Tax=Gongylonema pulchrum TaxID=637853 RepID=A0A183DGA1_9BILA|nr:unnamed protein product [Gongylonema pulchrum]
MQMANLMTIGEATTVWQLYNHCSSAFLQIYLKHANARGQQSSYCLTDFVIHMDAEGRIQLQNAFTGKFICFNKREKLAVRVSSVNFACTFGKG